jgi:hypothetical protein
MEDTTNFIVEFTSDGEGASALPCISMVFSCNFVIVIVLCLVLSSRTQEQINVFSISFAQFKQQFDQGVAVQLAMTL